MNCSVIHPKPETTNVVIGGRLIDTDDIKTIYILPYDTCIITFKTFSQTYTRKYIIPYVEIQTSPIELDINDIREVCLIQRSQHIPQSSIIRLLFFPGKDRYSNSYHIWYEDELDNVHRKETTDLHLTLVDDTLEFPKALSETANSTNPRWEEYQRRERMEVPDEWMRVVRKMWSE